MIRVAPSKKHPLRRRLLLGFGILVGFVLALPLAALFSLRFAAVRNYALGKTNAALSGMFKGRLVLHSARSIGLGGVGAADAEVFDPSGRRVLDIHGLDVKLNVPTFLWAVLAHKNQALTVRLSAHLAHAEVALFDDGQGVPTLADTWSSPKPSPPSTGPGTTVIIEHADFEHIWAHGAFGSVPPLDVELKHGELALRSAPETTFIDVKRVHLIARGLPQSADPVGDLVGSLDIPAAADKALTARAHYRGTAAGVPLTLDASFVDSNLAAKLEAKDIPSAELTRRVPALKLRGPASLNAEAHGKLPTLDGTFELSVRQALVNGDFHLQLQQDLTLASNVRAQRLDLSAISEQAPVSNLDFNLQAALVRHEAGPVAGKFELHGDASSVAGQAVPPLDLSGTFAQDPARKTASADVRGQIAELGARTHVEASIRQSQRTTVEFHTDTALQNPPRLAHYAPGLRGQGQLQSTGTYSVEDNALHARVNAQLHDLSFQANRVRQLTLKADVSGVLPQPDTNVRVDLVDAQLAGQQVSTASLAVRGSLARAAVSAEVATQKPVRRVQVSTIASTTNGIALDHPSINFSQGDTNVTLAAISVVQRNGRTQVDALRLSGVGTADISLTYGQGLEKFEAHTQDLDLARLWHLADPNAPLQHATASLDVSYGQTGGAHATVKGQTHDITINALHGGTIESDLTLANDQLDGTFRADLKQLGHLNLQLSNVRAGNWANPNPEQLTGKIALEGEAHLKDLSTLLPKTSSMPLARARGVLTYDLAMERPVASNTLPTLHLRVKTQKLQLAGARDTKTNITTKAEALAAAPPSVKGLDIDLDLTHAESGETELAAELSDPDGKLFALSLAGNLRPRLDALAAELPHLRDIPLTIHLTVPPRRLDRLPIEVRPAGLNGTLSAEVDYQGTINAPDLKLSGRVQQFRGSSKHGKPVDLTWQASYAGTHGKFSGDARNAQHQVGKADLDFETALSAWLDQHGDATPALDANAELDFDEFPIALIPGARANDVRGSLSGKLAVKHFGTDAAVDAALDIAPLKLGQAQIARIHTEVTAGGGKARLSLRVEDSKGVTTADAHSGLDWGSRLAPNVKLPADAELHARGLRLAAASPLLTSTFGELDGYIDGDLNAHFNGGPPSFDGHLDMSKGVAQVAAVGQRFSDIQAHVGLQPGKAKLESLSARATSGRLTATGEADFSGLDLTGANMKLRIAKKEAVSLSISGNELGDAYGAIDVSVKPGGATQSTQVGVNIAEFHVYLPDTGSQSVQDLDPAKDVRVGIQQRDQSFVTLPLQPLSDADPKKNERPTIVDLNLGSKISVQRGDTTKVQLGGRLKMTLGDPATMYGSIDLRGGKLDVSGKQFEVESGKITFDGPADNPTIVATARWDSPDEDQHRVYAEYTGTAQNGKITLRSEPPLTQDQILSLLLLGSPDGSLGGSSSGSNAATAVGAVGGAATQGVNKVLSSVSQLDVSTRIDTSTGSARPELVVQLTPKVSASITRALGAPPPGAPPDLTFLVFDFRIRSRWSLSALVGDRGETGHDLIWRRRY